ncbi:beta-1,6-N-acetylglucosaminyltransferase [Acinetobacter sp. ANC 7201]|uniref:beta-1,6-N-acetylglucosaminyltransferase n=1 Tax=Acinetobacter sp. ANC 7201 TaxID=3035288 RepID=UPI00279D1C64|nr:beta-1,6-N-acetylglucosaminyltransferase [Acinetobacter sp. ANC 7201]WFP96867.1 beta-1,6-N-acetylglucosaminyltransferase [Acinetobacter sp. ANC 7201]
MKVSFLILSHKVIDHIYKLAFEMPDANFYVHLDAKIDINFIQKDTASNVYFIKNRVDIKWGGFSMIQATLNLIKYALLHDRNNEYFHLISADDVFLSRDFTWGNSDIFMECKESKDHQYRMRFDTPHADTQYQRTLLGKALTQLYKNIDKILPTKEKFYFGSQWFSIRRNELEILMNSITESDIDFFRKKLCPDEHFFQHLIVKSNLLAKISTEGNKRFIKFDLSFQRGSSPIFLNFLQLMAAKKQNYWFARKVEPSVIQNFYLVSEDL